MTNGDIIKILESWRYPAQQMMVSLKPKTKPADPHAWNNQQAAHTTIAHIGSMIDYELSLLRLLVSEGDE